MASIFGPEGYPPIPYIGLAPDVMAPSQKLIPFLGAGASLAGAPNSPERAPLKIPGKEQTAAIAEELGLTGKAKEYLHEAIEFACNMQAYESQPQSAIQQVLSKPAPPSAGELATALAAGAGYRGRWPFSLLSVASYHEFVFQRPGHWSRLQQLFASKTAPLSAHQLVAEAARHHIRNSRKDYLIITTNYDQLQEIALDNASVPYCVLTVDRNDRAVDVRFSETLRGWLGYSEADYREFEEDHRAKHPQFFNLANRPKPIAVVYKVHGCLHPTQPGRDSIILSDEDYIAFLRRQGEGGEGILPAAVKSLMQKKGFLFLGYSFSDWNIRGLYKMVVEQRAPGRGVQDYTVLNFLNPYESAYFAQQTIHILVSDLVEFVQNVRKNVAPDVLAEGI